MRADEARLHERGRDGTHVVEHLLKQLVGRAEVVCDAARVHLAEVAEVDVEDAVQELEHEERLHLARHERQQVDAVAVDAGHVELG